MTRIPTEAELREAGLVPEAKVAQELAHILWDGECDVLETALFEARRTVSRLEQARAEVEKVRLPNREDLADIIHREVMWAQFPREGALRVADAIIAARKVK